MRDRIVPRRLVVTSKHFHRAVAGVEPAGDVRVHVAGIDLVRDGEGSLRVLEDNVRTPSGISYVVENRRAMTHVFPELFASHRVRPVANYPARLLEVLRVTAPTGVSDPTVVVLTPGVHNAAYFEHSFLAGQMGVELVEGRDLVCRDNRVFMRTTAGEEPVHVVYRRVDDEYLDPLHFRADSMLGCAGLINSARAGNVAIANFVGNGVADDKAMYPYVPAMIEYYLGEKPMLDNVETYDLADPDVRDWALDRLDGLVWKPVDGSGGYGLVIGPHAAEKELVALGQGRASRSAVVDRADRRSRCRPRRRTSTGRWGRATSTCARSRCTTARRSGSCPVASPASRCRRAASSSTRVRAVVPRTRGCSRDWSTTFPPSTSTPTAVPPTARLRANLTRQPPDPGPPVGQQAAAQQQQQQQQ